jgi:hypothetical protein
MVRIWAILGVAAAVALSATAAAAAPSFHGYTGLVFAPTADVLDADEFNLAAFTVDHEDFGRTDLFAGNIGVREGLEAGAVRIKPHSAPGETVLSAKYRIQPETMRRAGLAVGVFDPTDEIDATTYVVLSKTIGPSYRAFGKEIVSLRAHGGFGGGQLDGLFLGMSAGLGDRILLMGEFVQSPTDSQWNFGARVAITSELRAHVAVSDEIDSGLGISWNKML